MQKVILSLMNNSTISTQHVNLATFQSAVSFNFANVFDFVW